MAESYHQRGLKALSGVDIESLSSEVSFGTCMSCAFLGVGNKKLRRLIRAGLLERPTRIGRHDYNTLGALRRCRDRLREAGGADQ